MSNNHDTHDAPAGDHDAHGAGPEVEAESSPVDTAAPTPLSAFVWPGIIALLVLILVWGPVTGAFARYQGDHNANGQPTPTLVAPTPLELGGESGGEGTPTTVLTAVPTAAPAGGTATLAPPTDTVAPPTATVAPTDTTVPPTVTTVPATATEVPASTPTTGAELPPAYGDPKSGAPRTVEVGGKTFRVEISNTVVPDWVFSKDPAIANWVSGTVVNYVLGISYDETNADLFAGVHPADTIRLTRADGAVYNFTVDQARRAAPSDVSLLAQDHPAITLLLLGDPAPDRALIQGHFSDTASR